MTAPDHIYDIFIRATPEAVWHALLDPEQTTQYLHGTSYEADLEAGADFRSVRTDGSVAVDGVVEVIEAPHRLVLTWHVCDDDELAAEPPGRVEWTLAPATVDRSITRVTLRHADLALSPLTWSHVRLGWVEIIDGLKTLLETGEPLPDLRIDLAASDHGRDGVSGHWHRSQAIAANNAVWGLLGQEISSPDHQDQLLDTAHAAAYHWARAAGRTPANSARASWLLSRCHVVLGHGDLALHHAEQSARVVADSGLDDFDLAYAHEARARALACLDRLEDAAAARNLAAGVDIVDPDDRSLFTSDLDSGPWFGLEAAD